MSREVFEPAGSGFGASFVNRLNIPGRAGEKLAEHRLVAELAGGHVDNVGSVDKILPEFLGTECAFDVATGENQVVNPARGFDAEHTSEIGRRVRMRSFLRAEEALVRIEGILGAAPRGQALAV